MSEKIRDIFLKGCNEIVNLLTLQGFTRVHKKVRYFLNAQTTI